MATRTPLRIHRNKTAIVAPGTVPCRSQVSLTHRRRLEGSEADVTGITGRDRRRHMVGRLSQAGRRAVVAIRTFARRRAQVRIVVIHRSRRPGSGRMVTTVALCPGLGGNVRSRLALGTLGRIATDVTGRTLAVHPCVVHLGRNEGSKVGVTSIAGGHCRYVACRLTWRLYPVVTIGASSRHHAGMRIGCRRPGSRIVAGTTRRRSLDMRCRLGQRIGTDKRTVVAGLAVGRGYTELWVDAMPRRPLDKACWFLCPVSRPWLVARVTCRRGWNMRCRLARRPCTGTCVTGGTGARRPPEDTRGMA